ncbi:hypothetical protein G9409_00410 [Chlorobium sp. BLA1]|uniref:hypothetical protein n=1 Tax=Candidatus Chlorobium masyuteum TaxID=2716876 RepID=UPI001421E38A|nr:hypothetical protein [Candidatus Chlorobium masyuteum]NHQ59061.1 hypothetical protein [Candidatus Chlorobium masyuteum]
MKRKASFFFFTALLAVILLLVVFTVNQLSSAATLLDALYPNTGTLFLLFSCALLATALYSGIRLFSLPIKPDLPDNENSRQMAAYSGYLAKRMPVHSKHPDASKKLKDLRWVRTNLKFLEVDSLNDIKQFATKNFFVGALAQNTSYGTTTTLLNNIKMVWAIYILHNREQHLREFILLVRSVYEYLPLADFKKEEIPAHIKPIIQSAFSNTLSSLLPAGNLLTPFFMNLFLAGATNTYLTCLAGIIATRHCQVITEEDEKEVIQQSMFEASFMLKEIVRECNPLLSVTISKAVKQAGIESLDTVQPSSGSGIAQDIVSHLASSLKNIIRENISQDHDDD